MGLHNKLTPEKKQARIKELLEIVEKHGTIAKAAYAMGITYNNFTCMMYRVGLKASDFNQVGVVYGSAKKITPERREEKLEQMRKLVKQHGTISAVAKFLGYNSISTLRSNLSYWGISASDINPIQKKPKEAIKEEIVCLVEKLGSIKDAAAAMGKTPDALRKQMKSLGISASKVKPRREPKPRPAIGLPADEPKAKKVTGTPEISRRVVSYVPAAERANKLLGMK